MISLQKKRFILVQLLWSLLKLHDWVHTEGTYDSQNVHWKAASCLAIIYDYG